MNGIFSLPPAEPVKKSAPALVPLDGLERHDLVVSLHLLCAVKGLYEARLCDRRLQVAWSCGHEHDKAGAIDCACAARDRMRPLPEPPPAPHPDGATHYRPADETYHRPGPDGYITQVWRPKRKRWVDGELRVTNLSNERIFLPLPKPLEGDMQDPNDPGTLDLVEACKRPLTGAERQKRRREKLRKLKEAEGLKPVLLTERERAILQAALALDHESRPLPDPDHPVRLALLDKLAPENGAPERVAPPSLLNLSPGVPELERVWNRLPTDFSRAATTIGILRLRNSQHAELLRAVEVLQARLREAGLSDDLGRWYWNQTPPRDYRPTTPPEYLERISCEMTMSWGDDDPTRNL